MGCISAADADALSDVVTSSDDGAIVADVVEIESNDVSESDLAVADTDSAEISDGADLQDQTDIPETTVEEPANPKNVKTNALGADGVGTYKDLWTLINGASSGSTITLQQDYAYDSSVDTGSYYNTGGLIPTYYYYVDGLLINKDITINGNGHYISGSNGARIFDINGGALTLNDLTLKNGNAANSNRYYQYGGAIYSHGSGATLNINNCNLTDNHADGNDRYYSGGAIYSTGATTILNSMLKDNSAFNGGAFTVAGGTFVMHGSVIFDNTATNESTSSSTFGDNGFRSGGSTNLTENWWGSNKGPEDTIATSTAGTSLSIHDWFIITETLTSVTTVDVDFALYRGGTSQYTVAPSRLVSVSTDNALLNTTSAYCPEPFTIEFTTSDDAIITVSVDHEQLHLMVFAGENKKNITDLRVVVEDVILPAQPVAYVYSDIDGVYNLTLGTQVIPVTVTDGVGQYAFTDLDVGKYTVIVSRVDDPVYKTTFNTTEFEVKKYETQLAISTETPNPTFGNDVTITHTLTPEETTGTITYFVDGSDAGTQLSLTDDFVLSGLSAGEHTIVAKYSGDLQYAGATSNTLVINVAKANLDITVEDVTVNYPNKGTVSVTANNDGEYTISVNDVPYTVTVVGGQGSFDVDEVLNVGEYAITWDIAASENYTGATGNAVYTVLNAAPDFAIDGSAEINYGQTNTITHTINDDAQGTISYSINGGEAVTKDISESFTTDVLDAGHYTVTATYSGDANYGSVSKTFEFDVLKIDAIVTVENVEVYYPNTGIVTVNANVPGTYIITINSKEYEVTVGEDGSGSTQVTEVLEAGKYDISVSADLGVNYNPVAISNAATYIVIKANAFMTVTGSEVELGEPATVNVKLVDAEGTGIEGTVIVTVYIGDDWITEVVQTNANGEAQAVIPVQVYPVDYGVYDVNATFIGNDNFAAMEDTSAKITILRPWTATFDLVYENITYGDDLVIRVENVTDVDGNPLSGTVFGNIENATGQGAGLVIYITDGSGSTTISRKLSAGIYNMTATFTSDFDEDYNFYYSATEEYILTVDKAPSYVIVVADDAVYGESATATIFLVDENGNRINATVTVLIYSGEYYNDTVELVNGTAVMEFPDLAVGTYEVIVNFAGNENYLPSSEWDSFNITKATPILEVEPDEDLFPGQTATVIFTLTGAYMEGVSGTILVTVDGKEYVVVTDSNGQGQLEIPGLLSSTYPVTAKFIGNDNYGTVVNDTEAIKFMYKAANFDIVIKDIEYGDDLVIIVENATDLEGNPLTGIVFGNIVGAGGDGAGLVVNVVGGSGSTTISRKLNASDYTADATFVDEDYEEYISDTKNVAFTVKPATGVHVEIEVKDYIYNEDDTMNFTVTDKNNNLINGTLYIRLDGGWTTPTTLEDGKLQLSIVGISPKVHCIEAIFEDKNYLSSGNFEYFNVQKLTPEIEVTGDVIEVGEVAEITVKLIGDGYTSLDAYAIVTVNDVDYSVYIDQDGNAVLTISNLPYGEYPIRVKYLGNDYYNVAINSTEKVVVDSDEIIFDLNLNEDNTVATVSNAKDAAGEAVDGYIMGELLKDGQRIAHLDFGYLNDGEGSLALPTDLGAGEYTVMVTVVTYDGASATQNVTFTIEPKDGVQVAATAADYPFTQTGTLIIDVTDANGNPLSGTVNVLIDGQNYTVENIENGHLEVELGFIDIGEHVAEVIFTNPDYIEASGIANFNVNKVNPVIEVTGAKVPFGEPATVTVKLTSGDIVVDGRVIVVVDWTVDGLTQVITLEEGAGEATFNLSPYVGSGEYTITATYLGNDKFNEVVNNTEKVVIEPSTVMIVDVTANEPDFGEDVILTVTATDEEGNDITLTVVSVTIGEETKVFPVAPDGTVNLGPLPVGENEIEVTATDGVHNPGVAEINVTVSPASGVQLAVSVDNYPFDEVGQLVITVNDFDGQALDGKVYIEIDGELTQLGGEITGGQATINLNDIEVGEHVVNVIFENPNYLTVDEIAHFNVTKVTPQMTLTGSVVEYGESSTVAIKVVDAQGNPVKGTVIVAVDWIVDGLYDVVELDENGEGEASFRLDHYVADGVYDVKATFIETENYTSTSGQTTVSVTPSTELNVEITVAPATTEDDVIITVTATDGSGAQVPVSAVNVTIGDVTTEIPVSEDGTVNIGKLPAGANEVTIGINDGFHDPVTETETIVVSNPVAADTIITVTAVNISYGDVAVIEFTLQDANGNDLTGNLNVTVGEVNEIVEVSGGKGSLTVPNLNGGHYAVVANYEGVEYQYAPSEGVTEFDVARNASMILFKDMNTTTMDAEIDGRNGEYFYWTLVDANGNPIAGRPIQIGFNGKVYNRTTDENGSAKLQINLARTDIYTFAISFLGDDDYNGSFVVAKITTFVTKPTLTVPNKSYSASAKTKTLTATFKSNLGNPIPNRKVTFTVDGKTYSAVTNDKGVASVNVSLSKKGTYTVTTKFAGDGTFNATSKTSTLKLT